MAPKEVIPEADRELVAGDTAFPSHYKHTLSLSIKHLLEGQSITVSEPCKQRYPRSVRRMVGGVLMTACDSCNTTFMWVDRTDSWIQT